MLEKLFSRKGKPKVTGAQTLVENKEPAADSVPDLEDLGAAASAAARGGMLVSAYLSTGQSARDFAARRHSADVIGELSFSRDVVDTPYGDVWLALYGGHVTFSLMNCRITPHSVPEDLANGHALLETRTVSHATTRNSQSGHKVGGEIGGVGELEIAASLVPAKSKAQGSVKVSGERQLSEGDSETITKQETCSRKRLTLAVHSNREKAKLQIDPARPIDGPSEQLYGKIWDGRIFSIESAGGGAAVIDVSFRPEPWQVKAVGGTGAFDREFDPEKQRLIDLLLHKLHQPGWDLGSFIIMPPGEEGGDDPG